MKRKYLIIILFIISFMCNFPLNAKGKIELEKRWETSGFLNPESVLYYEKGNIVFVSNVNGDPLNKDGNGFISKVSVDGKIKKLKWIEGLNAPKGLAIYRDYLYVSDIDSLVVIDINKNKKIKTYAAKKAKFLNDVSIDKMGNVFVSDMNDNAIYRLKGNKFIPWLKNEKLNNPNGLKVLDDYLYVASWKGEHSGQIRKIFLKNKQISLFGKGVAIGNLDGLENDVNGNFFVSDWMAGKVFFVDKKGNVSLLKNFSQGSADISYNINKKWLFVPLMKDGKVLLFDVKK